MILPGLSGSYVLLIMGNYLLVLGAISGLKGVKAKQGFWIPISGIAVQGSDLVFKVGPVSKAVPRSAFDV